MRRLNEFELAFRGGDSGVKYLQRGPRIDWGVILLKSREKLAGHYHNEVEESFYILQGQGTFTVNGQEMKAIPGDVYTLEPQEEHEIANSGDHDLKLVFIKAPFLPEDKVDL